MNDMFPWLGLIGLCVFLAVMFTLKDAKPPEPAPAPPAWRESQPIERDAVLDAKCGHIPLDGDRQNLRRRLECEGIEVLTPCDLTQRDREAFAKMGVEVQPCP